MNRKSYWNIAALVALTLVVSTVTFLTSCSSSSHKTTTTTVSIAATSGTPQSAAVGTAFAAPLVATVTTNGTPTSGVSVTFTAPASGASGTFGTPTPGATDTETTNASGVATSQIFTANTTAGAYAVTASAPGATAKASFSLSNTAGAAANLAATSGGGQSAVISTAFANPLVATVTDSDSNPVSGVMVTFTAPASGASGLFADGGTPAVTDTEATDASGNATSTVFTANATVGGPYNVVASATGLTSVNFALTNTVVLAPPPLAAGNYVYSITGEDNNPLGASPYFVAGVFTVDASGAVTGGEQSFSDDFFFVQDSIVGATSSVVAGNNGNVVVTLDTGDTSVGVGGVETFDASMVTTSNGLLSEYDTWASGSGTLDLQTSTAAPAGGYAFFNGGIDLNGLAIVIGGVINVDSAGGISGAGSIFDQNDGGTTSVDQTFAASTVTAPDTFGSVTFTLNPTTASSTVAEFTMVGYIVDANNIKWVENWNVDGLGANAGGVALGQNGKNGTYNSSSLSASSGVFWAAGADDNLGGIPLQTAGLLTFNADGTLGGTISYNDLVVVTPNGGAPLVSGGTWTIDASGTGNDGGTGRVTIANVSDGVAVLNFQIYLAHAGATVISMDAGDWVAGLGYGQSGSGAFTAASFSGNYAMNVNQQDTFGGFEYDGVGAVTADGVGTFTGFTDLNGNLSTPLTPTPGLAGGVTGTFTASATGVFPGTITGISSGSASSVDSFTFYLIGAPSGASVGVIGIEDDGVDQLTLGTFELLQ